MTLTIEDDDKKEIEPRDAELVLAGTVRSMASDAVDVLAGRFDASPASDTKMTLAGHALQLTGASLPDGQEPGVALGAGRARARRSCRRGAC